VQEAPTALAPLATAPSDRRRRGGGCRRWPGS